MKTDKVEKIIKRKFKRDQSLQEQTTPDEYAQISFESAVETMIETKKNMVNRTQSDKEIEDEVNAWAAKVLSDNGGDYKKALNMIP